MPDTLSNDALNDERLTVDRRHRTAHLGPLTTPIAEVIAAAIGFVEASDQPQPDHEHGFEMAQDAQDAAYERLEEAVKALASSPPVHTTWHQGSGSRPSEDRSYVFDAEGRVVASLNYLHPDYEANAHRILGAGAPDRVKAQLYGACVEALNYLRVFEQEVDHEGNEDEHGREMGDTLRAAIAAARGEVSRG